MSKRRKYGPTTSAAEGFTVRWHSIANPATPSADIMSSPDPLNDDTFTIAAPPSSQRSTRSLRSNRFTPRASSPRKQQFELEVGDNTSPQRLLVTVETDDQGMPASGTRRRLFPSPSPYATTKRPRLSATTTTVPLKESIEDEYGPGTGDGLSTPRKRGRPRKTNGTPIPSAVKKRRAGTPIRRTPKRPNTATDPDPLSDPVSQATPTPKRRGRPPKRPSAEPSSAMGTPTPRRGRPPKNLSTAPLGDLGLAPNMSFDQLSQPSPTPKRRGRPPKNLSATPLGDLGLAPNMSSDQLSQPSPTPKRRGRPPKSITAAPPYDERLATSLLSDQVSQASPTPKRRGRPPKIRSLEPSSELGDGYSAKAGSALRGRRRRQALAPDELEDMAEEQPELVPPQAATADSEEPVFPSASTGETEKEETLPLPAAPTPAPQEAGSDIWMATLSDEATPRAAPAFRSASVALSEPDVRRSPSAALASVASDAEGFGEGAPSVTDRSSVVDMPDASATHRNDTVAQEDFSMIFMDSIQSFQDFKSSRPGLAPPHNDLGEETNQIINSTLETLRHGPSSEEAREHEDTHAEAEESEPVQQDVIDAMSETRRSEEEWAIDQDQLQDNGAADLGEDDPGESQEIQREPSSSAVEEDIEEVVEAQAMEPQGNEMAEPMILVSSPALQDEPDELASDESSPVKSVASLRTGQMFSPVLLRSPRKANISPLRRRVLDSAMKHADVIPRGSDGDAAGERSSARGNEEDSNMYEDSFSEIPQAVLEAATPRRPAAAPVVEPGDYDMEAVEYFEEQQEEEDQATQDGDNPMRQSYQPAVDSAQQAAPSNASSAAQTDNGRLPTPDDTPPNIGAEVDESPEKSAGISQRSSPVDPGAQLASEHDAAPPVSPRENRVLESSHQLRRSMERGSSALEFTPLNQMSSPIQDPQSVAGDPSQAQATRPALSAIVRAGRVLQSVTSDPPSPGDRQNQLGSPFRSSASKESWSGSRDAHTGRRVSSSPGRRSLGHHRQSASLDRISDDPFGVPSSSTGQGSFMQALGRSVQESTDKPRASSVGSVASSMRITPPGDEMSWVANEGPISPNLRGDNSLREAAISSTIGAAKVSFSQGAIDTRSDEPEAENVSRRGDDETDIWELEAQRSEPDTTLRQQSSFISGVSAPLHRRSALPSPWTRKPGTSGRASGSRVAPGSSNMANRTKMGAAEGDSEEYSLLEQRQKAQEAEAAKAASSATKVNAFDLSSFFSSPAAIPGKLVERFFPSKPSTSGIEGSSIAPIVPTSSMFPSVPQGAFEPREDSRVRVSSPSRSQEQPPEEEPANNYGSASPDTPERLEMPISAQKKNFTPRPRQTNQSFFQPTSARSSVPTPPRMQLSHADIQRWQQETSNASEESSSESSSRRVRESPRGFLRPLPPRNASPTKSSLRSPLKPHTPGRVVEFTSSVLSPVEQARQRQQRRLSNTRPAEAEPSPQPGPEPVEPSPAAHDKENQDSDVSMSDASPLTKPVQRPETLSQTVWTRSHWLFMDKLLQHRRKTPFGIEVEPQSAKYLGKTVKSHGESMVLEQWHLDCVDAFKAVVGGWDEGVLAKRLFSLIMGEKRRQRRSAERDTALMFH